MKSITLRELPHPVTNEVFDHIKTLEDDATKARELIDLLIETCPESRQIIATFAHNVITTRKA